MGKQWNFWFLLWGERMQEGRKLENFKGKSLKASLDVDLLKTEWEKQHMNTCLCLHIPSDHAVTAAAQPLGTQAQRNVLWPASTQLCCAPVHTDEVGLFILGKVSLTDTMLLFPSRSAVGFSWFILCRVSLTHNVAVSIQICSGIFLLYPGQDLTDTTLQLPSRFEWDFPGLYCAGSHWHNTAVSRSAVGFFFALQENLPAQQA